MKILVSVSLALVISIAFVWWFSQPGAIGMTSSTHYLLGWQGRTTIDTSMGQVTGLSNGQSAVFLGLPYARPPVDELRFRAPKPAVAWTEDRQAVSFPNICTQGPPPAIFDPDDGFNRSEDCLYLNVFTPAADDARRPVLVWIHGGSFTQGSANDYDGSVLAEQGDVVVVAINYRLGVLGFLDLSGYGDSFQGSAANGIADQIQALRWVREHIASFGGDAGNVTIFGESAGGKSVMAIMASPSADSLYHKAISHSGGAVNANPIDGRPALAEHFGVDQELLLGILENASADDLLRAQTETEWGGGGSIDGVLVTRGVMDAIMERGSQGVPLIAGSNRDEGTLFSFLIPWYLYGLIEEAVAEEILEDISGEQYVATLVEAFPEDSSEQRFERVWSDLLVRGGVNATVRASAAGPGGWLYRFDLPVDRVPGMGATHAAEIGFTFNNFARDLPDTAYLYDPKDPIVVKLAQDWSNTVIHFAKTGNPNGAGLPHWPRYTAEDREAMILDRESRVASYLHAADRQRWGDSEVSSCDFQASAMRVQRSEK